MLVAHATHALIDVDERVTIEYLAETPNYDPEAADLCFNRIAIDKGDLERRLRTADFLIEGEYRTGHQEQLISKPTALIAVPGDGR